MLILPFQYQEETLKIFCRSYVKSKSIRIHIKPNGEMKISHPPHTSPKTLQKIVNKQQAWISSKLDLVYQQEKTKQSSNNLLFCGERITIKYHNQNKQASHLSDQVLNIYGKDLSSEQLSKKLQLWYRQQAEIIIKQRLDHLSQSINWLRTCPEIKFRRMQRRWGSCSKNGVLTFNTHLIKAPIALIDSVIIHEICHLREFNHSPKFYQLMSTIMPDWKQRKMQLKQLTPLLFDHFI